MIKFGYMAVGRPCGQGFVVQRKRFEGGKLFKSLSVLDSVRLCHFASLKPERWEQLLHVQANFFFVSSKSANSLCVAFRNCFRGIAGRGGVVRARGGVALGNFLGFVEVCHRRWYNNLLRRIDSVPRGESMVSGVGGNGW